MASGNNLNRSEPVIDFTSADSESVVADMISFAQANFSDTWTDFNAGQLARVNLDLTAYQFDLLMFYLNALINECFVPTALRRQSLIDLGRALDFRVPSAGAANVTMTLTFDPAGTYPVTILASTHRVSNAGSRDEVIFMPVADVTVVAFPPGGTQDIAFVEGDLIFDALGASTGLPDQRFLLPSKPVIDGTLIIRVAGVPWTEVDNAVDMAASDEEFRTETDEQSNTTVIFGDGINGKIPPLAAAITAEYKIGGGKRGNLQSGVITNVVSMPLAVTAVTNGSPSTDGSDAPDNRTIRRNIPASLRQNNGAITAQEVADAALLTAGVAKAFTDPGDPLTREINLYIAPDGGGFPTDVLKNQVLLDLATKKMVGQRIAVQDPVYKQLRAELLINVLSGFRQFEAQNAVTAVLTNPNGTGAYDFDNVNFGGLEADGQPEASVDTFHQLFDALGTAGVGRVEVVGLDVVPGARLLTPNTGDGTVGSIATPTNDHKRREWVIAFTGATTFVVRERIVGTIKQVQDSSLIDDTQNFTFDLLAAGFTILNPDRRAGTTFSVLSNTTTQVNTTAGGLFLATEPGASYYIERTLGATGTVGVLYNALDKDGVNVLDFLVTAGGSPFSSTDEIIIDVFPPVSDIILRPDEILQLTGTNLTIRLAGGVAT